MSKPWQPYDPLTVAAVIDKHLQSLEECIRAMLTIEP